MLTRELGISRTVLREALVQLEMQGFVRRTPSRRWVTAMMTAREAREIYACRAALGGLAMALAATNATEDDLDEAESILDQAKRYRAQERYREYTEAISRFHDRIVHASRNAKLEDLLKHVTTQVLQHRHLMVVHGTRDRDYIEMNEELVKALRDRSADRARAIAEAHAEADLQGALRLFEIGVLTEGPTD